MRGCDDAPAIPLPRRPYGIETFRVAGRLESEPVQARWDGRWAIMTNVLWERVALALAVDEALADTGHSPEQFMLAVVTCCDDIDVAEFEIRGRNRIITPDEGDEPR